MTELPDVLASLTIAAGVAAAFDGPRAPHESQRRGLIHRATDDWLATALWTVAAGACSPRWYKSTEGLSAVMAVTVAAALLDDFQPAMQAVAGAFTGLSLVFGLNLALYNATALAAACLFALMRIGLEPMSPEWPAAGLLAGLAPAVFLFATVSGLWTAYVLLAKAV